MWPWPLTFGPGNGARQIVSSWVVFVPYIKRIRQIGMELRSGHAQNLWPMWHLTFDLEVAHDTSSLHTLYLCHIFSKFGYLNTKNTYLTGVTLTFDILTWRRTCHKRLIEINVWWKFQDDTITGIWWKNSDRRTDRRLLSTNYLHFKIKMLRTIGYLFWVV